MILIFDLDDTLYEEITFVHSGFKAVGIHLYKKYGFDPDESFLTMIEYLKKYGRGKVFNYLLLNKNIYSKNNLVKCINIYRSHKPSIFINKEVYKFLLDFGKKFSLYLVTDGNKLVQHNKITALGIYPLFKKVFITHNYGLDKAKPSLYCFEKIKNIEACNWSDIFYIGDNPNKDFVNLNKIGANTIRILSGNYKNLIPHRGYDAKKSYRDIISFFKDLKNN